MIRPLRDMLVLHMEAQPGMVGRLHLPDLGTSQNKNGVFCRVIAAGPKCVAAKVGGRVHIAAYGANPTSDMEFEEGGVKYLLIRERDINGVVE